MSNVCLKELRSVKTGNPQSKSILRILADRADNENFRWRLKIQELSQDSELSRSTVCKWLNKLEEQGFIKRIRFKNSSAIYELLPYKWSESATRTPNTCTESAIRTLQSATRTPQSATRTAIHSIPTASFKHQNGNPKNGNGNGNGSHADPGGKVHLCRMCPVEHEWRCGDEFDDTSYELTCPNFRKNLKGAIR